MARAFLIVLDSAGIGGAPDADRYFNGDLPDTGANTVAHIAQAVGGLHLPHLDALGLGAAVMLASGVAAPGLGATPTGLWGAATEISRGKDTPSGHWELAGVPVPWGWHYFRATDPAFPPDLSRAVAEAAGTADILGNCHAPGTTIIEQLGAEHLRKGWPICYTSVDSVFQVAAHEAVFDLARLYDLCAAIAPRLHAMNVGRVIARPFTGDATRGFRRLQGRRDFAIAPPAPTLCDWAHDAGRAVHALGKVGDIFSMRGIDDVVKGGDAALLKALTGLIDDAEDGSLIFANLVEFDSDYGHRRDPQGYAEALRRFDQWLGTALGQLREGDMLLVTADHGNDPTWSGTDHTRERVPVLIAGRGTGTLGHVAMTDIAASVAAHLGIPGQGPGRSFL